MNELMSLDDIAEQIRGKLRRAAFCAYEAGELLIEVKSRLPHGEFGDWIRDKFDWDERQAQRFMVLPQKYLKTDIMSYLPISTTALMLLGGSSVPEEARDEALSLAKSGERISVERAKEIIKGVMEPEPSEVNPFSMTHDEHQLQDFWVRLKHTQRPLEQPHGEPSHRMWMGELLKLNKDVRRVMVDLEVDGTPDAQPYQDVIDAVREVAARHKNHFEDCPVRPATSKNDDPEIVRLRGLLRYLENDFAQADAQGSAKLAQNILEALNRHEIAVEAISDESAKTALLCEINRLRALAKPIRDRAADLVIDNGQIIFVEPDEVTLPPAFSFHQLGGLWYVEHYLEHEATERFATKREAAQASLSPENMTSGNYYRWVTIGWLTGVPVSDTNFKYSLQRATPFEIGEALAIEQESKKPSKTRINRLQARQRALGKAQPSATDDFRHRINALTEFLVFRDSIASDMRGDFQFQSELATLVQGLNFIVEAGKNDRPSKRDDSQTPGAE